MVLRDYQTKLLNEIKSNHAEKLCVQAATGFGKTVIFTTLAKEYKGRVLILVDSRELIGQTAKHFIDGATFEAKNKVFPTDRIVVSMVQTLKSRLKKKPYLINDFDIVIIDECHILAYEIIFDFIKPQCKVIGFTATPVSNRKDAYFFCHEHKTMRKDKECCDGLKIEFTKPFALGDIFDDIEVGIPIKELIDGGHLVPEENYIIPLEDSNFDLDRFGEVTQKSADEVFDVKYQMDVLGNYKEHCEGKKTMIFTQNTSLNAVLYQQFIDAGIDNCLMYDSVNESDYSRSEVVDRFRNTPGAILFNVGVFTKGFDVTDVEAIIVSRRISSLSLWIQIVGRGSRTTNKIFKDKFIVIDGGTNIERLGRWSDEYDWRKLFESSDNYKPKKEAPEEELKDCEGCGEFMPDRQCICMRCDHNNCKPKEIDTLFSIAVPLNIIAPDANKIIRYAEETEKDVFYALRVLNDQIFKMFKNVPREQYQRNLSGGVERVIRTHLKSNFYKIIYSDLESNSRRTYLTQRKILLTKLNKHYGIEV